MSLYETPEAVKALSQIDPEFEEHVKKYRSPPPVFASLDEIRQHAVDSGSKKFKVGTPSGLRESTLAIPSRDGFCNEALMFKPATSQNSPTDGLTPLVVLIFGGGFIGGTNLQLAPYARGITKLYGATAICISYRVAPEYPFPTAPNDVWDAVQWITNNTSELGVNLEQGFILGGASAGANLACVTAHRAVAERMNASITGVWACVPAVLPEAVVPERYQDVYLARKQNAVVPGGFLDEQAIEMTLAAYKPDDHSPDFSPFNRPDTFAGMPPVYIQVAGLDPLRDDALIYDRELRSQGSDTVLDVYPGVPHGFSEMKELTQTRRFGKDVFERFAWLLHSKSDAQAIASLCATPGYVI